jgi:hypothetical protein
MYAGAVAAVWWLWSLAATTSSTRSPWSPAKWRIDLDITYNPNADADADDKDDDRRKGQRLVLPTIVSIESEKAVSEEADTGQNCNRLSIVQNPSYVTVDKGSQTVALRNDGGWRISTRRSGNKGTAGQLFLWLDVLDGGGAERNDVRLDGNQRLYLTANCWRDSELTIGLKKFAPILRDYEAAQRDLELKLSHERGDRRLDGTDLIDTAMASMNMAILVRKRDECRQDALLAELTLPNKRKMSRAGHWPGSDEPLTISNGLIIGRSLQKSGGGWFGGLLGGGGVAAKETVLGKWRAVPLEEPDEDE